MTTMQRCVSAILYVLIISSAISYFSFASDNARTPLVRWDISATETDAVSASLYEIAEDKYLAVISGEGSMKAFSATDLPPWFPYADGILYANIGSGVKNLAPFTFNNCFALERVYIEACSLIIPAEVFPIPEETEIFAHLNSNIKDYLTLSNPEKFSPLCSFDNSVCTVCDYECLFHKGGNSTCAQGAKCEICGVEYESKLGHDTGDIISEMSADCYNDGMMAHYVCSRCEAVFDEEGNPTTVDRLVIPKNHNTGEWISYKPPKCTEYGIVAHYHCDRCGANLDDNNREIDNVYIPVTDHSGGKATCTSAAICDVCKSPYGEIDLTNHSFSSLLSYDTLSHWRDCACGEISEIQEHTFASRITKPESVEEDGVREYSCICGYKYEEAIPKLKPTQNPNSPSKNDSGNKNESTNENGSGLIFIICGSVAVSIAIATVIIVPLRRKNKK